MIQRFDCMVLDLTAPTVAARPMQLQGTKTLVSRGGARIVTFEWRQRTDPNLFLPIAITDSCVGVIPPNAPTPPFGHDRVTLPFHLLALGKPFDTPHIKHQYER
jgi:hypothetical protein